MTQNDRMAKIVEYVEALWEEVEDLERLHECEEPRKDRLAKTHRLEQVVSALSVQLQTYRRTLLAEWSAEVEEIEDDDEDPQRWTQ